MDVSRSVIRGAITWKGASHAASLYGPDASAVRGDFTVTVTSPETKRKRAGPGRGPLVGVGAFSRPRQCEPCPDSAYGEVKRPLEGQIRAVEGRATPVAPRTPVFRTKLATRARIS